MRNIKQINIKIEHITFLMTWLISKGSYKNINIYYTRYITIKKIADYENIYSLNPLYLIINT